VAPAGRFCYFVGVRRVKAKLQLRSCKSLICRVSSVVEQRFCKALEALPPFPFIYPRRLFSKGLAALVQVHVPAKTCLSLAFRCQFRCQFVAAEWHTSAPSKRGRQGVFVGRRGGSELAAD
jgi:hypothetical protein